MSLRSQLIVVFLAATLAPLAVLLWVTSRLFETSLSHATTAELDQLSQSLRATGLEMYKTSREILKADALAGRAAPRVWTPKNQSEWPPAVADFAASGQPEWFGAAGPDGEILEYLTRAPDGAIHVYQRKLGAIGMNRLTAQFTRARETVARSSQYDLRRGLNLALLSTAAAVYVTALAVLLVVAFRVSRPMRDLTRGLQTLAAGNLDVRLQGAGRDEAGQAIAAFNDTAAQLAASREQLVQLTRAASWQSLARKMAHEVKNSLTPIRLTMEEIGARNGSVDATFLKQASQIVADEVTTLEKRVRAFSDFSSEPAAHLLPVDCNALVAERVAFLKPLHPNLTYNVNLAPQSLVLADPGLLRGVLTNLLENAAQAIGPRPGRIEIETSPTGFRIDDDGPGLSELARSTLFEPTITFKKDGMGLGLSIARRSVLQCGGEIEHRDSPLGGASFLVTLPPSHAQTLDR